MLTLFLYVISFLCFINSNPPLVKSTLKETGISQEQFLFDKIQRMVDEFDSLKGSLLKSRYNKAIGEVSGKEAK